MLFKLLDDTFIRIYGDYSYIINQHFETDRIYDQSGNLFLSVIDKQPREIKDAIHTLYDLFGKRVSYEVIKKDFTDFLSELENNQFIVTGLSVDELALKEHYYRALFNNTRCNHQTFDSSKNELPNTRIFINKIFYENPTIFSFQIELTSYCNENCIHCYIPQTRKKQTLKFETVCYVLDQLSELNTLTVTFSGGEPLLHPQFKQILKYARKRDFLITILTNLTHLSDEILKLFKEINIYKIQVSLYSLNPEIHDYITQTPNSFHKTINNIMKLYKNKVPVVINCPLMKENYLSYKELFVWAQEKNIQVETDFLIMAKSDCDTSNLSHRLNLSQIEQVIKNTIILDKHYRDSLVNHKLQNNTLSSSMNKPICSVGFRKLALNANGKIIPCAGWDNYVLGDITNECIKDIWHNSIKLNKLRNIKQKSFPECVKCQVKEYCSMCLLRNYNENNGNLFKINPIYCQLAHMTKRIVTG